MAIGGISFEVEGDVSSATKSIDSLGQRIGKLAQQWDVSFDDINQSTQSSYQSMAKAASAVQSFGREAVEGFGSAQAAADKFAAKTRNLGAGAQASQRAMQGATTNMAAQFQDIGVQAQMGASSMAIAIQQGTQLGAVMASSAGGIAGLARSVFSLLSPMNLLGIALAFAAAELAKWLFGMLKVNELRKTEDVLKDTTSMIKEIGAAVPGVTTALGNFQQATMSMMRGDALVKQLELTRTLASESEKAFDKILNMPVPDFSGEQYGVALQALQRLTDSAADGTPDLESFHKQIELIINSGDAFSQAQKDAALNLTYMVEEVMKANAQFPAMQSAMLRFFNTVARGKPDIAGLVAELDHIAATTGDAELRKLADQLSNDLRTASNTEQALAAVNKTIDLLSGKTEKLTAIEKAAADEKKRLQKASSDYAKSVEQMAEVVPKVAQSEQQRLDTLLDTAIATAADGDAMFAAVEAYRQATAALAEYNAMQAARAKAAQEQAKIDKPFNDALEGMREQLPKIAGSGQLAIDMFYAMAEASGVGGSKLNELRLAHEQVSAEFANTTGLNAVITSLQAIQAEAPKVGQSTQQLLDTWHNTALATETNAQKITQINSLYSLLTAQITTANNALALHQRVLMAATTAYPTLNALLANYAQQLQAGRMTGETFIQNLQAIANATDDINLKKVINDIIEMARQNGALAASTNGVKTASDAAAPAIAAVGQTAATTGAQAGGAVGGVNALTGALYGLAAAARAYASAQIALNNVAVAPPLEDAEQVETQYKLMMKNADGYRGRLDAVAAKTKALERIEQRRIETLNQQNQAIAEAADPTIRYNKRVDDLNESLQKGIINQEKYNTLKHQVGLEEGIIKPPSKGGGGKGGGGAAPGQKLDIQGANVDLEDWSRKMLDAVEPTHQLAREQEILKAAVEAGWLTQEQAAKVAKHLAEQYGETAIATFDLQKEFATMMQQWGDQVASSLASAIVNGEDLGEVFKKLLLQLAEMALQMLVLKPLMGSIMAGFGMPAVAAASVPIPPPAANANLRLPAPGMLGARNATIGRGTTNNNTSSLGGMTINFNGVGDSGDVKANGQRAKAMGERLRSVVQGEMIRQSRPGGLMWGGGGGRR